MSKCNNCYHNKVCIDGANYKTAENCKHYVSTADVQEVVRCRDCKFNDNCSVQYYAMFKDIDYCSRGIKKDGDDNDKNRI